jgi:hypothetical protein
MVCAIVKEKLESKKQFALMIRGTAGVGKSHVIKALTKVALQHLPPEGFALCAPTGCAAFDIGGCTLHKSFVLPVRGDSVELLGKRKEKLEKQCKGLTAAIADEDSMMGRRMLGHIDNKLRQGKTPL